MRNPSARARALAAVLAACLAAAWLPGCRIGLPDAVAALGYVNARERFAMNVPPGWEVREQAGRPQLFVLGPEGPGGVRPNVNVVVEPVSAATDQAQWQADNRKRLEALEGFQLVSETPRDLVDGRQVRVLTFRHRVLKREVIQRQMGIVAGGTVYVVTATGDPDTFAADEPNFEICLLSFRAAW